MSQSPSYQRDAASASPESPEEGDFSPRQLCDKQKSLEEHKTCEDQRDPIVNIIPDNRSSSRLNIQIRAPPATNDLGKLFGSMIPQEQPIKTSNWRGPECFSALPTKEKLPVSPEFTEVRALDGRFITVVSTQAQTDWEWVEQSLSFSCQVQKEIEDPKLLRAEMASMDTDSSEDQTKTEYDIPRMGPPRLIAHKPEPKQTPHAGKVPEVESKQDVHLARCDYCQQLCQPFSRSKLLENETDFERLFCCERAKQMAKLILEEREELAQEESDRKIAVGPHAPIMSEEEREAAIEQAKQRWTYVVDVKPSKKVSSHIVTPCISDEPPIPVIDIKNITDLFTQETDGVLREVNKKFYKSGKCFCTLCPDGTGNVFYPSGRAAIIISSAEAADFTYIILEDKDKAPSIKGIFTNKGHSTCYYPNGMIWLNLTPVGGVCLSEAGAMRRRWNWLYFDPHVRDLPFKPLTFALGPHISVRIHSQDRMYIAFAHQRNNIRFSVGSKLKLVYPESHERLRKDVLERYVQMKSAEIYSLLGQMQTCLSHRSATLSNVTPHYGFVAQARRLSRQMEKEKSHEKIKAHVN